MRPALALAGFTALVLASAPSVEGADADRPRVALSVSPAQLAVSGAGLESNQAAKRWCRAGRGRRYAASARPANGGEDVAPDRARTVTAPPGRERDPDTPSKATPTREPGDHHVLVLLTTRPLRGGRVNVQVRPGVRVRMVVPGRIVRQRHTRRCFASGSGAAHASCSSRSRTAAT